MDAACGTGGILSITSDEIKTKNPDADVRLFGQEYKPEFYAICLANLMIRGQNVDNIYLEDTMKKDCFRAQYGEPEQKMRYVLMNPSFGEAWAGKRADKGVKEAVEKEHLKGFAGRFGAGLPASGDTQMLFIQHAISKMDENNGRAAILSNGSPLFSGATSSGESQIRRWLVENDLIEAIIALPTELFYNTGIGIYAFIFSKNKRPERINKIQLINATSSEFWVPMKKSLGNKRKEISAEQIEKITKIYADFRESEYCKIYDKEEFLYKEYTVYQPLQRNYAITEERIKSMIDNGALSNLYNQDELDEIMMMSQIEDKDKKKLEKFQKNKPIYDSILEKLKANTSEKIYKSISEFRPVIQEILNGFDKKIIEKVIEGLSVMDKNAENS